MPFDPMNAIRRIGSAPGFRRIFLQPKVRRFAAGILSTRFLIAAWATTTPWAVLRGEVFHRGRHTTYIVTSSGLPVAMKHGRDIEALYEIFSRGEYEPPAALRSRLGSGKVHRILDIGGNVGMFSSWAAGRWPAASIVTFEPDPANLVELRRWAGAMAGDRIEVVAAAAATAHGTVSFASGHGGGSYLSRDGQLDVAAVDIFDSLPTADFVKMDIEGGEWPILQDPRLKNLRQVTLVMEYHRLGAPSLPAKDAAAALLRDAGFSVGFGKANYWGHGTLWVWKD